MAIARAPMLTDDHAAKALEFLAQSDAEFAAGDRLQASEKLWGAATHAVMAAAQQRGWRHGSHRALKEAAKRLSNDHDDIRIMLEFGFAKSFTATSTTTTWTTLSWTRIAPWSTISFTASWPCSDRAKDIGRSFTMATARAPMLTNDHAAKALEFLAQSDAEFAEGDHLQASEKLWAAATHAVMAGRRAARLAARQQPPRPERSGGTTFGQPQRSLNCAGILRCRKVSQQLSLRPYGRL